MIKLTVFRAGSLIHAMINVDVIAGQSVSCESILSCNL
jgi:hypothetical protein